jgi:outer membrane lipoprotein SlyB
MSTAISPSSTQPAVQPAVSGVRAVPMAVWAVIGALALATAGLTGALVTKSMDAAPAAPATHAALMTAPATAVQGQAAMLQPMAEPVQAKPQAANNMQAATGTPVAQAAVEQPRPAAKPSPVKPRPQPAAAQQAPAAPPTYAAAPSAPLETTRAAVCHSCGTIESVQAIQEQGEGSGLGAVAGGLVGGLLGNQVGGGNGKKAMTVIGAVGGGLAGHEVEKRARATTSYDVRVRMEDGSVRSFRRAEPMPAGTRVTVDGNSLRVAGSGGSAPAPRAIYTVAPAGQGT